MNWSGDNPRGGTAPSGTGPPYHAAALICAVVTALLGAMAVWLVTPAPPPGFYWDDTWYLLMAEWLRADPETWEMAWTMLAERQYPPLFPFLIVLSGASLADPSAAFAVNAICLALAAGAAIGWFLRERMTVLAAVTGGAFIVLNPVALHWLPTLFSEHLYLLLSTAALGLAATGRRWAPLWLLIGLLAGLTIATRTVGWALAFSLVVHLLIARRVLPLVFLAVGTGFGLLMIPFLMVGLPPAKSYFTLLALEVSSYGWDFFIGQLQGIAAGWVRLWGSLPGALLVAALAAPGWFLRLRANGPEAGYVPAYLGILLIWPFPEHMDRFLWPLAPAVLVAIHALLGRFRPVAGTASPTSLAVVLVFLLALPTGAGRTLQRVVEPPPADLAHLSRMPEWTRSSTREQGIETLHVHAALLEDMRAIRELTAPGFCVFSELPALVTAQARRIARASPWSAVSELPDFPQDCPYYYLMPLGLPGTTDADVDDLAGTHEALFRSRVPHGRDEGRVLGAFFGLVPPPRGTGEP